MDFLAILGCETHFKSELKSLQIDQAKPHIKFLAINVDFNGLEFQPSRFNETCTRGHQRVVLLKVTISSLLASLPWKQLQIGMDMLPITTSTNDELCSRINISDFERPWTPKISDFVFLQSSAAPHISRVNFNEMAGDRQRQFANVRLVSINSNFLFMTLRCDVIIIEI